MKTIELHSDSMQKQTMPSLAGTEGARRATGVPANDGSGKPATFSPPDPEVTEKKPKGALPPHTRYAFSRSTRPVVNPGKSGSCFGGKVCIIPISALGAGNVTKAHCAGPDSPEKRQKGQNIKNSSSLPQAPTKSGLGI